MATAPRVLDLAGTARTTAVEIVATPVAELLTGLHTFQFEEAADTFDVGPGWFDRIRTTASHELTSALAELGPMGWGNLLAMALVERWPIDATAFIDRVESLNARELWTVMASVHLRPFADRFGHETFERAAAGDQAARTQLADTARALYGEKETETGVWQLSAEDTHRLLVTALRAWYRDVFAAQEATATAILERDAEAKRRLHRTMSDDKLIEVATHGVIYEPEPWVRRIVLTPHLAMRPWNVSCAHGDTYVFCYPVADDSIGIGHSEPPAHLLRLHKALADERRLRILKLLSVSDRNLQELSDALGLAKSTAHHHTVVLRAAGLIRTSSTAENRYSLRRESLAEAGTSLVRFLEGGAS